MIYDNLDTINQLSFQFIAEQTKLYNTTISESFPLWRRNLLFSTNYETVVVVSLYDVNITSIIDTIYLCKYLKETFDSKVILVTRRGCGLAHIYTLFSQYYNKLYKIKRLFELDKICGKECVTKFVHSKTLHIYENELPQQIGYIEINKSAMYKYITPQDYSTFVLSAKSQKDLLDSNLPQNIKQTILVDIKLLDHRNSLDTKLGQIIASDYYININAKNQVDYLVPFLNIPIFYSNNSLFSASNWVTKSIAYHKNKIHTLDQMPRFMHNQ